LTLFNPFQRRLFKGRQVNQAKALEWQDRLRRFEECDLTVARFCAHERVTVPPFSTAVNTILVRA